MRRIWNIMLALLIVSFAILPAMAYEMDTKTPIDVTVNGSYILMDARPFMVSGTTYVPVRFVSEAMGADVYWNAFDQTAEISYDGGEIRLPVGKNYAYVNGRYVEIKKGVKLHQDRTFVPIRFIAESMGAEVSWDGEFFTVCITNDKITVPRSAVYDRGFDNADLYWLARVIEAEAAGEPFEGKLAVGSVVINRIKSREYPNTVFDVVFDTRHGVQFEPILNGTIYNNPSYDSMVAAKYALMGENNIGDCLYFFNPRIAQSTWISKNRTYYTTIGLHDFYL